MADEGGGAGSGAEVEVEVEAEVREDEAVGVAWWAEARSAPTSKVDATGGARSWRTKEDGYEWSRYSYCDDEVFYSATGYSSPPP